MEYINDIKIEKKSLREIDYKDNFFDSLRKDYYNFDKWYISKMNNNYKAYVTYNNNKLSSFLLLKIEDKTEIYSDFVIPFTKAKRLKICTMKVKEKRKNIGKSFVKIIDKYSIENKVEEIYITINKKHLSLVKFLKKYNFNYYGDKITKDGKGNLIKEQIYVKRSNKYE